MCGINLIDKSTSTLCVECEAHKLYGIDRRLRSVVVRWATHIARSVLVVVGLGRDGHKLQ
jgi:hypothetical protein